MRNYLLFLTSFSLFSQSTDPALAKQIDTPLVIPDQKGKCIFFTADLLIWEALEDGLEYAYKNTQDQTNQSLTSFEPKTKFEPAFRLGLGGFLPYDQWVLSAVYTNYSTHLSKSTSFSFDTTALPGPGLISVWTNPAAYRSQNTAVRFENAHNRWKLKSSFLDLVMERNCPLSSRFSFTPEFGLRSAWIHQHYSVDYTQGNTFIPSPGPLFTIISSSIDMTSFSNNVGPFFGIKSAWQILPTFSFFANTSTSLLASYFHLSRNEENIFIETTQITNTVNLTDKFWSFRPQANMLLGLRYFYNTSSVTYSFSAAYEAEVWWKQNGLLRYIDELNTQSAGASISPTQGDLVLHGVNLQAGISY